MSFHQLLSGRPPMTRRQKDPLRPLTSEERRWLARVARSHAEPASHVARAKALLAVADGMSYTQAAKAAGRRSGDAVSNLLWRFNREGLRALEPGHGGGPTPTYTSEERERILAEARRAPDREKDGTAEWSLTTLRRSLRGAPEGLPSVSTHTIWKVLHEAGFSWQKDRSWCESGKVERKRKDGEVVEVVDPDAQPKKVDRARLPGRGARAGSGGMGRRRGWSLPNGTLPRCELGATRATITTTSRVRAPGNGKAFDPVPPGHGRGAGTRGEERHQRSAPPLAQGATG